MEVPPKAKGSMNFSASTKSSRLMFETCVTLPSQVCVATPASQIAAILCFFATGSFTAGVSSRTVAEAPFWSFQARASSKAGSSLEALSLFRN